MGRLGAGKVESFTIITTEPNDLIGHLYNRYNRMPVIFRPEDERNGLTLLEQLPSKANHY